MNAQQDQNDRPEEESVAENESPLETPQAEEELFNDGTRVEDEEVIELNETTEISGNGVPQPVSAHEHINQPLIEPAPYATEPDETLAAADSVSAQYGADSSDRVDPGFPEPGPEQTSADYQNYSTVEQNYQQQQYPPPAAPPVAPFPGAPMGAPAGAPGAQQPYYGSPYPGQNPNYPIQDPYYQGQQSPYYPNDPVGPPPPREPEKRSNRVFGLLMAVLGVILFAGLLMGALVLLAIFSLNPNWDITDPLQWFTYPHFYLAVLGFTVVYLLIGLLGNRIGWWFYIFGGYLTALGALAGFFWGRLIEHNAWYGAISLEELFTENLFLPTAMLILFLGREIPLWIGGLVSGRGRKLNARYDKERSDYLDEREKYEAEERARHENLG